MKIHTISFLPVYFGWLACLGQSKTILPEQSLTLSIEKEKAKNHETKIYKKYKNFAKKNNYDTGVVVIGYNRLKYFKQVIDSLAVNSESKTLPFFFILDGGPDAKQKEYSQIITSSFIKEKYIIKRPFNYGCDRNIIAAIRFMFEICGFKRIIHFEDDIVVASNYLTFLLNLDEWAHSRYSNIGIVQGNHKCTMSFENKRKHLHFVFEQPGLFLGYCMRKNVWNHIKKIMNEHEQFLVTNNKPSLWKFEQIHRFHEWITSKLKHKFLLKFKPDRQLWPTKLNDSEFSLEKMAAGQDSILNFALYLNGYIILATLVNRVFCIGKNGVTFNEQGWTDFFGDTKLDQFTEDNFLYSFKPFAFGMIE